MPSKQILIVVALVAVCVWSAVMTALGQLAAVVTLVPSLGLLVQQIAAALGSSEQQPPPSPGPRPSDAVEGGPDEDEAAVGEGRTR